MSPGNLYRYFPSKEALIAGIAERDRAEVAQEFANADLSHGLFAVLEGMAHHHFAERPDEQVKLCTEIMAEARRHPEIARISASFDADVKRWLIDLFKAGAERGDIPHDVDFDGAVTMLMIIADGVWWRRALDPEFQAGNSAADVHGHRAPHAARRDRRARGARRTQMKASRITAVGLVAAAALWIASGHFLPHETPESRAAVQPPSRRAEAVPRRRARQPTWCRTAASWCCPAAPRPTRRSR